MKSETLKNLWSFFSNNKSTHFMLILYSLCILSSQMIYYPAKRVIVIIDELKSLDYFVTDDNLYFESSSKYPYNYVPRLLILKNFYTLPYENSYKTIVKYPFFEHSIFDQTIKDGEFHDINLRLRSAHEGVRQGYFKLKIQNNFGYIIVDWEKQVGEPVLHSFADGHDYLVEGNSEIIGTPIYSINISKATYRTNYIFYEWKGSLDESRQAHELDEESSFEITIAVLIIDN